MFERGIGTVSSAVVKWKDTIPDSQTVGPRSQSISFLQGHISAGAIPSVKNGNSLNMLIFSLAIYQIISHTLPYFIVKLLRKLSIQLSTK